jgi:hypothetical protein
MASISLMALTDGLTSGEILTFLLLKLIKPLSVTDQFIRLSSGFGALSAK